MSVNGAVPAVPRNARGWASGRRTTRFSVLTTTAVATVLLTATPPAPALGPVAGTIPVAADGAAATDTPPARGSAADRRPRPDVDGDGRADLVLGAYDSFTVREADGDTWIAFTPDIREGVGFGSRIAVGDFDGDGRDDLAASIPAGDVRENRNRGTVRIYRGTPGRETDPDSRIQPDLTLAQGIDGMPGAAESGDAFGSALAAGDLTGDGVDDLVIGVSGEDLRTVVDTGYVVIVPGSDQGLRPDQARSLSQDSSGMPGVAQPNDRFGAALAVGDVTGDGIDDLAVSSPGENDDAGMVHLVRGAPGGPTRVGTTYVSAGRLGLRRSTDYREAITLGATLAVGDLTGDGLAEVVVGAPFATVASRSACGAVAVLDGSASGLATTGNQVVSQASRGVVGVCEKNDRWGEALAIGDLDGDGGSELLVGTPEEALDEVRAAGALTVLPGTASGVTGTGSRMVTQATTNVPGGRAVSARFAAALGLVDVDGDGRRDVVVGIPGAPTHGAVAVLVGTPTGVPGATSSLLTGEQVHPYVEGLGLTVGAR